MKKSPNVWKFFAKALVAARADKDQLREQRLGAIGITPDGREFRSRNSSSRERCPSGHAEARLAKRLAPGSIVFVARARKDGQIGLAAPCATCRAILKAKKIKEVYFTIDDDDYGIVPFYNL